MPNKGPKGRKNIILVFSILLFSLALMSLNAKQEKGISFLDSLAGLILSPFQNLFTQSVQSVSDGINHYFDLVNVSKENDRLKSEVERLINEKNEFIERISRQKRIAGLMSYQEDRKKDSLVASVIGRDATQWSKVVFINKGTRDGVKTHLAVVTNSGVIGQIIHAGLTTSKVLLTIDSRSAVDALFQASRVSGVVVGTGEEECQVKFVPNTADVKVGDRVLSSGLGGVFPKGLIIGTVSQVVRKKQGLFQEITLTPSSDLSNLEEVLVLLS
ncbi:MAG: rod shape-determining protein MreC [Nitrospinae bacterium]|nr:rod shape-determining protein MreC [Nitrospinota bacterium]